MNVKGGEGENERTGSEVVTLEVVAETEVVLDAELDLEVVDPPPNTGVMMLERMPGIKPNLSVVVGEGGEFGPFLSFAAGAVGVACVGGPNSRDHIILKEPRFWPKTRTK